MLPALYKPYGDHTATVTPVLATAIRGLAIMGAEWSTLTMLEPAPAYVKFSTFVISVLVLGVLEWRRWLELRGRWYFAISLASLILIWGAICAYAYLTYVNHGISKTVDRPASPLPAIPPVTVTPTPATPQTIVTGSPLGPLRTLEMRQRLAEKATARFGSPPPSPSDFRWAAVISAGEGNHDTAEFLYKLMLEAGLRVHRLDVTDHSVNLDAPAFPKPGNAGITFHGDDALSQRLFSVLQGCATVRTTTKTVDGLQEWYRNQAPPDARIVWIEIGNGSPWKGGSWCWQ
jgi:hypothetical protein